MKRTKNILWGLLLIAVGAIWGLNAFEITQIDIFFDGWWTLFIIVPCVIGLFTEHDKTGNLVGIIIGIILLMSCQGWIDWDMVWKLVIPVVLIIFGVKLLFRGRYDSKINEVKQRMKQRGSFMKEYSAVFAGQHLNFAGEKFEGAHLTAVFGGIDCDLRQAYLEEDVVINACSIFGGVDVFVPENVNVKVSSTCIFGGISDKRPVKTANNEVTVYINATCIFGGSDIK